MNSRVFVLCLTLAIIVAASGSATAQAVMLELSPWNGPYYGEVIDVPSGDIETLWVHMYEIGPPPGVRLVDGIPEMRFELEPPQGPNPPEGSVTVLEWYIGPGSWLEHCVWYPLAKIRVDGTPCTTLRIWSVIPLQDLGPEYESTMPVWKHIVPEPSSVVALVSGLGALLALVRRRKG